jgi:hypothetical protein
MWASPLKTQQEVTKLGEEKHDEAQRGEQSRVIMADGSTHYDRQWVCGLGECAAALLGKIVVTIVAWRVSIDGCFIVSHPCNGLLHARL